MDRVYIFPTDNKPVKIACENDSCDSKEIEVDDLTGEVFVKRLLSPSERESFLRLINDGVKAATNFGIYV